MSQLAIQRHKVSKEKMKSKSNLMVVWCILITLGFLYLLPINDASMQYYNGSPNGEIAEKMNWMEGQIRSALASGCSIQVSNLVTYIETLWWPHIQYIASRMSREEQQQVLNNYARLSHMIGMRKCESDQNTFYQGQCYPVGIPGHPCPKNQQLYDGQGNIGYCYCQRGLNNYVYINDQCYLENEQGPCGNGQWLIVNPDRTASCQQAPRRCPPDGQHVYWGCGINTQCQRRTRNNSAMKCSRLGSQQPSCGSGARLYRSGSTYRCGQPRFTMNDWMEPNIALPFFDQQTCSSDLSPVSATIRARSCRNGDMSGRCRKSF